MQQDDKKKKAAEAAAAEAAKKKKADDEAKKKKDEEDKKKAEEEAKKKAEAEAAANPPPQKFSKFSIVSVIFFFLALVFGMTCLWQAYGTADLREYLWDENDAREANGQEPIPIEDDIDYQMDRTVTVGLGATSTFCFLVATICSVYAGTKHKSKSKSKDVEHCCVGGLAIGGWIFFCLTFILNLILLVVAFDDKQPVYPEAIWTALIGSMVSWMLMFGHSEMIRRMG